MKNLHIAREGLHQEVADLRRRLAELESADEARELAEQAVRDGEERFLTFASHTYDWECWHDVEGKLIYSSPSCYRMTGYSADEFYADLYGMLRKLYHPDDAALVEEHIRRAVAGPDEPLYLTHRIIRRDGQVRWLEHYCQSVYDSQGDYAGRRSCNRDITEQKLAQEQLEKSHHEMEQRVKDRTVELTETVERLHEEIQERIRAELALHKEQIALRRLLQSSDHERQTISYEIHDGLAQYLAAAIMNFQASEFGKDKDAEEAARAFRTGMAMLQRGHTEARRLISGVRPPILDESGIVPAIAHLVHEYNDAGGMAVELVRDVQFERLEAILENAIYRIVQETLANAAKHSGSDKARVDLLQQGERLRIEIRDWGKGFAADFPQEGCFGLEGIRERVRLLGGSVEIESSPGDGTRIRVDLPVY
jgi:PAS domain S-box-containing protein